MPNGRWYVILVCSCITAGMAAAPHQVTSRLGASHRTDESEIVVTGVIDRKKGNWKRAESDHVVVISKDGAAELTRISRNLERLYYLMSRLYRRGDTSDPTVKLQVVLFDSSSALRAMRLRNLRSEQGPYLPPFSDPTYYYPREDGEVLAIARDEQIVDLNTIRAFNLDCDELRANADTSGGLPSCAQIVPTHAPAVMTWEQMLYARFAQHFILTYAPGAYPRWYLDGIGALFSTVEFRGNGGMDYARPLIPFLQVFRSYGNLDAEEILTGRYLDDRVDKRSWTPYHAWLLAHFFLFSNLKPERAAQFRRYMTDVARGVPMADAAKNFTDMKALQREIARYAEGDSAYAQAGPPSARVADPLISTLPVASATLIEARIALGSRLSAPNEGGEIEWLEQVRAAARLQYDANAILFAAEAECRTNHPDQCLADAERVLAHSPDNVGALAWKGIALTEQAVAGGGLPRADTLALARKTIEQAIALDDQAPLPLLAYFQSFTKAREPVPEAAMQDMARVIRMVPAAPAPRLYLGEELVRQGKPDLARRILYTVLLGPYDSPERSAAQALFSQAGGGARGAQ